FKLKVLDFEESHQSKLALRLGVRLRLRLRVRVGKSHWKWDFMECCDTDSRRAPICSEFGRLANGFPGKRRSSPRRGQRMRRWRAAIYGSRRSPMRGPVSRRPA